MSHLISLTPSLELFLQQQIASGRYSSAEALVREGLQLLEQREQDERLQRSLEQAEAGDLIDGDTVFGELKGELRAGIADRTE